MGVAGAGAGGGVGSDLKREGSGDCGSGLDSFFEISGGGVTLGASCAIHDLSKSAGAAGKPVDGRGNQRLVTVKALTSPDF